MLIGLLRGVLLAAAVVVVVALGACGGDDGPAEPAIPPDAVAVRIAAAEAMGEVGSARFTIEREGAPVHIDDEEALAFERAEGRFAAPASSDAVLTLSANGTAIEVGAVAVDGETWITNPVTGRWEAAPESLAFDPATLFDPDVGWRPLLADGLRDVALVEPAPDEAGRYRLRGVADASRTEVLTGGLVEQRVPIDVWVDAVSGRVTEARFEASAPEGTSAWRIALSGYGDEIVVTPPDLGTGG
jgi:hypothetical protein